MDLFTLVLLASGLSVVWGLGKAIVDQRAKASADRLRLLEAALNNPALDRAAVENLAFQLTGVRPAHQRRAGFAMALLLAVGWLTLFSGVGVWVLGALLDEERAFAAGALVSIIGFGLVSYPFALRELEARRATS